MGCLVRTADVVEAARAERGGDSGGSDGRGGGGSSRCSGKACAWQMQARRKRSGSQLLQDASSSNEASTGGIDRFIYLPTEKDQETRRPKVGNMVTSMKIDEFRFNQAFPSTPALQILHRGRYVPLSKLRKNIKGF